MRLSALVLAVLLKGIPLVLLLFVSLVTNCCGNDSNTFTPKGSIMQVEYAKEAIRSHGGPIMAIRGCDGVIVIAARLKQKNSLQVEPARKIFFIDEHICVAVTGYLFESNVLIDAAKNRAHLYRDTFGSPMPIENLCSYMADILHMLTMEGGHRPLGVSLVVSGYDDILGPQIYTTDPEGSFTGWNAVSAGKGSEAIMESLADLDTFRRRNNGSGDNSDNSVDPKLDSVSGIWPEIKKRIVQKHFEKRDHHHQQQQQQQQSTKEDNSDDPNPNPNPILDLPDLPDFTDDSEALWDIQGYIGIKAGEKDGLRSTVAWLPIKSFLE